MFEFDKMISVIIATRNRPKKLKACLDSILGNGSSGYEIAVVDQSEDSKSKEVVDALNKKEIRYYKIERRGKSRALNFAISKAKGEIVAFTDDDCVVEKDWLKRIRTSFDGSRDISCVFGEVLPYALEKHKGQVCAIYGNLDGRKVMSRLSKTREVIFTGNNLAMRKAVFEKVGFFKEWLGVGAVGRAGEDEEMVFRILEKGYKVLLEPKVIVFHDHWLTEEQFSILKTRYLCGTIAAFFYHVLQGSGTAKDYLRDIFQDVVLFWRQETRGFVREQNFFKFKLLISSIFYFTSGLFMAAYFYLKDRFLKG